MRPYNIVVINIFDLVWGTFGYKVAFQLKNRLSPNLDGHLLHMAVTTPSKI